MNPSDRNPKAKRPGDINVPREAPLDDARSRQRSPRAAADVNPPDEEFAEQDKPLVAGSRVARALHKRPPKTKGTLGVGTAGDAARPSKPGIHNKPIPRRGRLG
jgi:hypothetical protein